MWLSVAYRAEQTVTSQTQNPQVAESCMDLLAQERVKAGECVAVQAG